MQLYRFSAHVFFRSGITSRLRVYLLPPLITVALLLLFSFVCICVNVKSTRARSPVTSPGATTTAPSVKHTLPQYDERRELDLGEVAQGEHLTHTFAIRNTTEAPFTVIAIKKSCGCETAELAVGMSIPVNSVMEVPYSVPAYLPGERVGRLVLTTNSTDDSFKDIVLTLRGTIQAKLWSEPSRIMFRTSRDGDLPEMNVRVESSVPGLLQRFRNVTTSRGLVTVELDEELPTALLFRVALARDAPQGHTFDFVTVSFDDRDHPLLNISVQVRNDGAFTVIPPIAVLDTFVCDRPQIRRVRVISNSRTPFRIISVDCPKSISVEGLSDKPEVAYNLTLTCSEPLHRRVEDRITLITEPPDRITVIAKYASP